MKILFFLLFALSTAHAAKIEDVRVLSMKYEKSAIVVKLQLKNVKDHSFFTVQIDREDEKALEKVALVLKKVKEKDKFRLSLDIVSFSPQSGSFYRSQYVTFHGSAEGASLIAE